MAESIIHKSLGDKRKKIQAYIGSLERDLEEARRDLSAIIATEHIFKSRGPNVTAYMNLSFMFPRHELPKLITAALMAAPDGMTAPQIAKQIIADKGLAKDDRHLSRAIVYKLIQVLRRWEKVRKVTRLKKVGTAIVWRLSVT